MTEPIKTRLLQIQIEVPLDAEDTTLPAPEFCFVADIDSIMERSFFRAEWLDRASEAEVQS